jgi:flagellar hook assembly protein FlgD
VRLSVYDVRGRCVARLADGHHEAGTVETVWNGRDDSGREAASGIYFARLETENYSAVRKMTLLR